MAQRPPAATILASIMGLGILCLPVFFSLMPNIETSRSEARIYVAFWEVKELHETIIYEETSSPASALFPSMSPSIPLPDLDPWGQPYRLIPVDRHRFRILSSGPNMSLSPTGIDSDDIHSDMSVSPFEAIVARKHRQFMLALAAPVCCWAMLTALYLRWHRVWPFGRQPEHAATPSKS